jgi:hypothetical protein
LKPASNSIFTLNQKRLNHFRSFLKRVTSFRCAEAVMFPLGGKTLSENFQSGDGFGDLCGAAARRACAFARGRFLDPVMRCT